MGWAQGAVYLLYKCDVLELLFVCVCVCVCVCVWMQAAELAHKLLLKNLLRTYYRITGMRDHWQLQFLAVQFPFLRLYVTAALTNYKNALRQICCRIERREFALDAAISLAGFNLATRRALEGLPAEEPEEGAGVGAFEFGLTGVTVTPLEHRLCNKIRASWGVAVKGAFASLTGSNVWPPVAAPVGCVAAALLFAPDDMTLYTGLKIVRPGVNNSTIHCSPSFHGKRRFDCVILNGEAGFAYNNIQEIEYGQLHCFFSYQGNGLRDLLQWGASHFNVDGGRVGPSYTQFTLLQRYRPCQYGNLRLPMQNYAAKALSGDFETELVAIIHGRAREMPWFHGTPANDMKQKKGAIFGLFK